MCGYFEREGSLAGLAAESVAGYGTSIKLLEIQSYDVNECTNTGRARTARQEEQQKKKRGRRKKTAEMICVSIEIKDIIKKLYKVATRMLVVDERD